MNFKYIKTFKDFAKSKSINEMYSPSKIKLNDEEFRWVIYQTDENDNATQLVEETGILDDLIMSACDEYKIHSRPFVATSDNDTSKTRHDWSNSDNTIFIDVFSPDDEFLNALKMSPLAEKYTNIVNVCLLELQYGITYETYTEESIANADSADRGWEVEYTEVENIIDVLREATSNYGIIPSEESDRWWTNVDPRRNYEDGSEIIYNLFFKHKDGKELTSFEFDAITILLNSI